MDVGCLPDADESSLPQPTLKLLGDFPEPLSETQRRAVSRHVAHQLRYYTAIRRRAGAVERGFIVLQRLVTRLQTEQAALETALAQWDAVAPALKKTRSDASATATTTAEPKTTAAVETAKVGGDNGAGSGDGAPPRRRGGLLLRSAAFSSMQRVLQTAKVQETEQNVSGLARQRDKIAKEVRLSLLKDDIKTQAALLEPLQQKNARAMELVKEAAATVQPLLSLLDEMWVMESRYPSLFAMKAKASSTIINEEEEDREETSCATRGADREEAAHRSENAVPPFSCRLPSPEPYEITFTPAFYTAEVEDIIRAQVEDVIDDYLSYRNRMDPLLYQLEQEQQAIQAKRVDHLMEAIGLGGAECSPTTTISQSRPQFLSLPTASATTPGSAFVPVLSSVSRAPQAILSISSSDEDAHEEDDAKNGLASGSGGAVDAATQEEQDREHIRTALTALDDFEDM